MTMIVLLLVFSMAMIATVTGEELLMERPCSNSNNDGYTYQYPEGVVVKDGLCARIFRNNSALAHPESRPRSLFVKDDKVFVLERAGRYGDWQTLTGYVVVYDINDDNPDKKGTILVELQSLDHGLTVTDTHVYASNSMGVYRWPYSDTTTLDADSINNLKNAIETVISDIPWSADQRHPTRTIVFDNEQRYLYLALGSENNTDTDSTFRSQVRRFDLSSTTSLPIPFSEGQIWADGVRNAVGIEFDSYGVLWGVEMGADATFRQDLGGDIDLDNPADEVLRMATMGESFGFPYCFSEYKLPQEVGGSGPGTQWAWEHFAEDPDYGDDWCRNVANNVPPVVALEAHSAPLGITFYRYQETWPQDCPAGVAFPKEWDGDAFVTYHGSYFRDVPIEGRVVRIPTNKDNGGMVDGGMDLKPEVLLQDEELPDGQVSGIRPVDVKFDRCGRLLVSSDGSFQGIVGEMLLILEGTTTETTTTTTSSSPSTFTTNTMVLGITTTIIIMTMTVW